MKKDIFLAVQLLLLIFLTSCGPTPVLFAGSMEEGKVDAVGENARFYRPWGMAVDNNGNLYVADRVNNNIRKITPDGEVSTLKTKQGSDLYINHPIDIAIDSQGNIYISGLGTIYKISKERNVELIIGDDDVNSKGFIASVGISVDSQDNLYTTVLNETDFQLNYLLKITPEKEISKVEIKDNIYIYLPRWVAVDKNTDIIYFKNFGLDRKDYANSKDNLHKITPDGRAIPVIKSIGKDFLVGAIDVDDEGNLYVVRNYEIYKISPELKLLRVFHMGNLLANSITVDSKRKILYFTSFRGNKIYKLDIS